MHHYIIGDDMKKLLWDLFKSTGKIEYYLKYKEEVRNESRSRKNI